MTPKPTLSAWQVCCICLGAFGIQFGFALPQANATRIFQNLGASLDSVPLLWLAGPITGLLVQPLVGYYSDRTWTRFGRRRPYFLLGATLAACALIAMPTADTLLGAALMLWLLDASLNCTMGPFRALIADQMPLEQRSTGYVTYMGLASLGAVIGSALPWAFAQLGVPAHAPAGEISDAVKFSFYLAAALLLGAVCWTALTTREYAPALLEKFDELPRAVAERSPARMRRHASFWLTLGTLGLLGTRLSVASPGWYVLVAAAMVYGALLLVASRMKSDNALTTILGEMESMSASMRWLALVQFCSWFTLVTVFVYGAPAVAKLHFGSETPGTPAYEAGANWVGVLFAVYNIVGGLAALIIPAVVRRFGLRMTHRINLWLGAAGLLSMLWIRDPDWLLASMVGFGFAWASIIALPYAMLANNLPARRMGVNIGIFNIFIVIPQLLALAVLWSLLQAFADGDPSFAFVIGATGWLLAGLAVTRVRETT